MPSFGYTLRRCHSTVLELMNSSAPISELVRPSEAMRAIWSSCAVSSYWTSTVRLRTVSPVAASSRDARSAKASAPIDTNDSCAVRRWPRASTRRCSRLSHSP